MLLLLRLRLLLRCPRLLLLRCVLGGLFCLVLRTLVDAFHCTGAGRFSPIAHVKVGVSLAQRLLQLRHAAQLHRARDQHTVGTVLAQQLYSRFWTLTQVLVCIRVQVFTTHSHTARLSQGPLETVLGWFFAMQRDHVRCTEARRVGRGPSWRHRCGCGCGRGGGRRGGWGCGKSWAHRRGCGRRSGHRLGDRCGVQERRRRCGRRHRSDVTAGCEAGGGSSLVAGWNRRWLEMPGSGT
mmetsp:Transcript_20923/g.52998  ORF Transcript_20923/g.52998 Transcript_20923/m.52998 type:complete len:238 (-) Transcript_20923:729-1442(-)